MEARISNGLLIIEIPLHSPVPSATGKTLVVASSSGFRETEAQVNGKTIKVNVTATVAR